MLCHELAGLRDWVEIAIQPSLGERHEDFTRGSYENMELNTRSFIQETEVNRNG